MPKEMTYVDKPDLVYKALHNANIKDEGMLESDLFMQSYFS